MHEWLLWLSFTCWTKWPLLGKPFPGNDQHFHKTEKNVHRILTLLPTSLYPCENVERLLPTGMTRWIMCLWKFRISSLGYKCRCSVRGIESPSYYTHQCAPFLFNNPKRQTWVWDLGLRIAGSRGLAVWASKLLVSNIDKKKNKYKFCILCIMCI